MVLTMRSFIGLPPDVKLVCKPKSQEEADARFRPLGDEGTRGYAGRILQADHRIARAQRVRVPKASPMTSTNSDALFQKYGYHHPLVVESNKLCIAMNRPNGAI